MTLAVILASAGVSGCFGSDNSDLVGKPDAQRSLIEEMYEEFRGDFHGIPEVRPAEVADAYRAGDLVLIDVRTPEEQAVSMIPGAITKEEYETNQSSYSGKRVVVYCTIGYRSGDYVSKLEVQGTRVENLVGSILLWTHEGLPLEDADGNATKRVHVYGEKWNLLPEGYEGIW